MIYFMCKIMYIPRVVVLIFLLFINYVWSVCEVTNCEVDVKLLFEYLNIL